MRYEIRYLISVLSSLLLLCSSFSSVRLSPHFVSVSPSSLRSDGRLSATGQRQETWNNHRRILFLSPHENENPSPLLLSSIYLSSLSLFIFIFSFLPNKLQSNHKEPCRWSGSCMCALKYIRHGWKTLTGRSAGAAAEEEEERGAHVRRPPISLFLPSLSDCVTSEKVVP